MTWLGCAPPDGEIVIIKSRASDLELLKWEADKAHSDPWKAFQAGAMCVVNNQIDKKLKRFGVEVKDD